MSLSILSVSITLFLAYLAVMLITSVIVLCCAAAVHSCTLTAALFVSVDTVLTPRMISACPDSLSAFNLSTLPQLMTSFAHESCIPQS